MVELRPGRNFKARPGPSKSPSQKYLIFYIIRVISPQNFFCKWKRRNPLQRTKKKFDYTNKNNILTKILSDEFLVEKVHGRSSEIWDHFEKIVDPKNPDQLINFIYASYCSKPSATRILKFEILKAVRYIH